jgi:SAM-dependent methyltransferase
MSDPEYEATREAWRAIWLGTDVERELQTRDYARSRDVRSRFLPHLPPGEPLLEAGCGLGTELIGLADAGHHVVGVDYVAGATERLKQYRGHLRLATADVHALPFRDGTFGAYLSFGVLEHFPDGPQAALREAFRVLRGGGALVVTVPAPNVVWRLARASHRLRGRPLRAHGYYETAYTARELRAQVSKEGFEIVAVHPIGHDFTLWGCGGVFRRPGYYRTSRLAEALGAVLRRVAPEAMSFATLVVARKRIPA